VWAGKCTRNSRRRARLLLGAVSGLADFRVLMVYFLTTFSMYGSKISLGLTPLIPSYISGELTLELKVTFASTVTRNLKLVRYFDLARWKWVGQCSWHAACSSD